MKKTSLIACAVFMLPVLPGAAFAAGKLSLAGKKYEVDLTEGGKTSKDTLMFTKKEFESMQCRQYGFKPSKYKLTGMMDSTAFESESKSKTSGTNMWSGFVKGQAITATLVWKKKGQSDKVYTGSGMEMPGSQASAPSGAISSGAAASTMSGTKPPPGSATPR